MILILLVFWKLGFEFLTRTEFSTLFPGWRLFHNYDHALLGRIWICGNPERVNIVIIHSMDQALLCHITALKDNYSFWCTAVYASNNYIDRRILWRHLLWSAPLVGHNPWVVIGNFNTTRFVNEKFGGNMLNDTGMDDFHEYLYSLELADVPFSGPILTWMNRREGVNFIARKFFFFWIIKNLFPKGQCPTTNNNYKKQVPKETEKRTAPPQT